MYLKRMYLKRMYLKRMYLKRMYEFKENVFKENVCLISIDSHFKDTLYTFRAQNSLSADSPT